MILSTGEARPEAEAALDRAVGRVGEHFLFVLLDGMGMNLLEDTLPPGSFLRRHLAQPMHSVFPATTTAALNSLASAVYPSAHGLPGWTVRTTTGAGAEITATPLPFIEAGSATPLDKAGVDPAKLFRATPIYNTYRRPAHQFSAYAGTEFSDYSTGWCPSTKTNSITTAIAAIAARWRAADSSETFTYWYNAEPDSTSHKHGWSSKQAAAELVALDDGLERLWTDTHEVCGDRTIIVSADHGHLECRGEQTMVLGAKPEDEELLSLLRCSPTVEPRTPGFHVRGDNDSSLGATVEAVDDRAAVNRARFAAAFRASRFGYHFALLTPEEAEALELFGPVRQILQPHTHSALVHDRTPRRVPVVVLCSALLGVSSCSFFYRTHSCRCGTSFDACDISTILKLLTLPAWLHIAAHVCQTGPYE